MFEVSFYLNGQLAWTVDTDHVPTIGEVLDGLRVVGVSQTAYDVVDVDCEWA